LTPEAPQLEPAARPRPFVTRRSFLRAAVRLLGVAAATGFYTWRIEPHWLEIVRRSLPVRGLPRHLAGRTLALLSDAHLGTRVDDDYLIRSFDRAAALAPDLVLYAGDFVDHLPDAAQIERVYSRFPRGRLATLGILGNHDYGPNWAHPEVAERVAAQISTLGVRVLRNEVVEIEGLLVAGLDDLWGGRFAPGPALAELGDGAASLVLSHNPDTVDLPHWAGYRGWILSGHTHGGQCKPPFLPPPLTPVRNKRYTAGEFDLAGDRRLYISRGIGHLLRVRFNVRPEITLFELVAA
jgi:uncharacterized protein